MKKLLLLGGGHAEIPLIQAAQELGYYVITTGNAKEGLGHPYANKNVFADFSDKEAMLALAKSEAVDAVCSGCNDFALLSTAYVCEKLGLPGHDSFETSLQIHHKDKYRALATRLGIETPKAISVYNEDDFEDALKNLRFPIIVKPVDLTGGKGILRANNREEALVAYKNATGRTRESHIVVEEFVTGTNHGFSAYLVNQKVAFYFADNEQYYQNKYMVSGANTPSTTSAKGLAQLVTDSEKIAKELNLVDGILHIQYIERDDGTPVIIEICRRPPGDLYIKFVKYATGIDYPKFLMLAETGDERRKEICDTQFIEESAAEIRRHNRHEHSPYWLRHCVMADREGIVKDVEFSDAIQRNIIEKFMWFKPGEQITDKMYYKAGIVFLRFETLEEMQQKTAEMTKLIKVIVK